MGLYRPAKFILTTIGLAALLGCSSGPEVDPDVETIMSDYNQGVAVYTAAKVRIKVEATESVSKLDTIILKYKAKIGLQRINLDIAKSQQRDSLLNMKKYKGDRTRKLEELDRKGLNGDFRDKIESTYDNMISTYRTSFERSSLIVDRLGKALKVQTRYLKEAEKAREQLNPNTYGFPGMDFKPATGYGTTSPKPVKPTTPAKGKSKSKGSK